MGHFANIRQPAMRILSPILERVEESRAEQRRRRDTLSNLRATWFPCVYSECKSDGETIIQVFLDADQLQAFGTEIAPDPAGGSFSLANCRNGKVEVVRSIAHVSRAKGESCSARFPEALITFIYEGGRVKQIVRFGEKVELRYRKEL